MENILPRSVVEATVGIVIVMCKYLSLFPLFYAGTKLYSFLDGFPVTAMEKKNKYNSS